MRQDPADAVALLRARQQTVATAESLTGGLVCAALTDVPGSSAVVRGGVVSYASDLKREVLGVDGGLLVAGGAVQAEVAVQMARGIRALMDASFGVSTTGVAGPDTQDGQPVGRVFIAVSTASGDVVRSCDFEGGRTQIRQATVEAAIGLLLQTAATRD